MTCILNVLHQITFDVSEFNIDWTYLLLTIATFKMYNAYLYHVLYFIFFATLPSLNITHLTYNVNFNKTPFFVTNFVVVNKSNMWLNNTKNLNLQNHFYLNFLPAKRPCVKPPIWITPLYFLILIANENMPRYCRMAVKG